MWTPLLYGAKLVIVPLRIAQSPKEFYNLLHSQQVTVLNQTPSALRQLLEFKKDAGERCGKLGLRLLLCGGDALPKETAVAALDWNIPLWNFYGLD